MLNMFYWTPRTEEYGPSLMMVVSSDDATICTQGQTKPRLLVSHYQHGAVNALDTYPARPISWQSVSLLLTRHLRDFGDRSV